MAEIRINATGGLKLYDADDSHYAQIVAGTITSNVDAITLGHDTVTIADNLSLGSDSAVLKFGADGDTTLTHTDGTGLTLNSTNKLTFGDAASYIQQSSDGVLKINGEATVDIDATAAITLAATNVPVTVGGIPFYYGDTGSIYTHDVSGTDDSAQYNTSYGLTAFDAITTGDSNTAVGHSAGGDLTTGYNNTFMGRGAGGSNTTGGTNTFIGFEAGNSSTTGHRNTVVGDIAYDDGFTSEGDNTVVGYQAMGGSAVGNGAEFNTVMGSYAADAITTGDSNSIFGYNAATALTTGHSNILIGHTAGGAITTGTHNIAIGNLAMDGFDTEINNIGIGYAALGGSVAGGEYNVMVGNYTGDAITSGDKNTCIGHQAGSAITTGTSNTCVARSAGDSITTGDNNICIGDGINPQANDQDHGIGLGSNFGVAANDFAFGKASNVVSNDFDADADWSRSSDIRLKRNIQDSTLGLDFINDLHPVKFQCKPSYEVPKELKSEYNEENKKNLDVIMHGFIAQEVKEAIDKHGDNTFGGWHLDKGDGVTQRTKKNMFVMPLIRAVQELSAQVTTLKDEINTLKGG